MHYDKVPSKMIRDWYKDQLKGVEFFCWIGNAPKLPLPKTHPEQLLQRNEMLKWMSAYQVEKPKKKYKKRSAKRLTSSQLDMMKERAPVPDQKTEIIRPKAVYDNKSPYGIASGIRDGQ